MLHQDTTSSGKTHGVLGVWFLSEEPVPVVGPGVEHLCSHGRSMPGIPRYLLVPRWTGSGAEG